jgi:glycosyltransferase involved in cell wall biosynthesis
MRPLIEPQMREAVVTTLSSTPEISVVITCYSEAELILEAVESVWQQSIPASEIVIVNDASPDPATNRVCQQLETHPGIRVVWRQHNGGPSIAREQGFTAAMGEILVPLDADDLLPETALEQIQKAFVAHPEAGFIYGNYLYERQAGKPVLVNPGDISLGRMLRSKPLSLSSQWTLIGTAPLRRSLWQSVGGCDPNLDATDLHDLEFWIRAIAAPCRYEYIPEVIYIWRKYLGKNSRRVTPMSWYRVAKKHFQVYCQVGLEYRAYELLLLGAKWSNNQEEMQHYSRALLRCIFQRKFQLPTLAALLIPSPLLRFLATQAGKRR